MPRGGWHVLGTFACIVGPFGDDTDMRGRGVLRVPLTFADRCVVATFRTPRAPTMQQYQDQE